VTYTDPAVAPTVVVETIPATPQSIGVDKYGFTASAEL
jgi:hypothetical protein